MSKKLTMVRNTKKRTYNGVQYGQVVEVNENNLRGYLNAGFEIYTGEAAVVPTSDEEGDATGGTTPPAAPTIGLTNPEEVKLTPEERAQRADFLKQMGVNVMDNWKDKTVVNKSDEMGYTPDYYDATKAGASGAADDSEDEEGDAK